MENVSDGTCSDCLYGRKFSDCIWKGREASKGDLAVLDGTGSFLRE